MNKAPATSSRNFERETSRNEVKLLLTDWQLEWLYKAVSGGAEAYTTEQKRQVQRRAARPSEVAVAIVEVEDIVAGVRDCLPNPMRKRLRIEE